MNEGHKRRRARACAWLLCLAQTAAAAHAQQPDRESPASEEQERAQARQHFEQGVANYDAERYEQALANFQEAYRLRPHPLVNVNIANCYDKLDKPLQAIFHFERFLESDAGTPAQRQEVGKALERLRKHVGQLLLRITPDGATVLIDQGEQRRAPILEPIRLEAGKHTLEVRLSGYHTVQRTVTVHGGTTLELAIALEPTDGTPVLSVRPSEPDPEAEPDEPSEAAPPEAEPPPSEAAPDLPSEASGPSTGVWIAGAITGVLAITGTITGVLALNAESEFDTKHSEQVMAPTPLARAELFNAARDAADRANALALTTDLLLFSAVISGVVTVILLATDDAAEQRATAGARLSPALAQRAAGLGLHGSF